MADRLAFRFIRMAKVVSVGEVSVDVHDPFDQEEIAQRLKNKEFAEMLFTDHEYDDEHWQFFPIVEVDVANDDEDD